MDEIIFRGSQRFEDFQIQLSLAAQQSKIVFQQLSERSVALANEVWHGPRMAQMQELAKELLIWVLEVAEKGKDVLFTVADPRKFIDQIFMLLRNEMNRRQLFFGCIGFALGSFVGYTVANLHQKQPVFFSHMKAAVCTNYNGIDGATIIDDIQTPKIEAADEILIQVKAASVSLVDLEICTGYGRRIRRLLNKYNHSTKSEFPIILGRSCSGIVLEIGQAVRNFDVGDEVYLTAPFWAQGTISETCISKEFRVGYKPKRIGFEGAAGLPFAGSLALNAISLAGLTKENAHEKRILIIDALTPTGCVLVQYCHLLGADVTVTTNMKAAPVAKALGADNIIITQDQVISKLDLEIDKPKYLKKELDLRDPFDLIFITKESDLTRSDLHKYCNQNGRIFSTLSEYLPSDHFGFIVGSCFWTYIRSKCLLQNMFGMNRSNFGEPEMDSVQLDILRDLIDNHQLQSVVDKVFHPHDIEQALEHVKSSNSIGSSIVTFR